MVRAVEQAKVHDVIMGLVDPKGETGYDAHVGERGVKLSGGQRQRVAIARVLLKDVPIPVLEEITSALDSEVEAAIQEQLTSLMQGKTVIAIAHRLSTIAAMDRLVVLEQGQIVEQGTHAQLLATGGQHAQLLERQSGGFSIWTRRNRNYGPNGVARCQRATPGARTCSGSSGAANIRFRYSTADMVRTPENPWTSRPRPIGCRRCCDGRLNSPGALAPITKRQTADFTADIHWKRSRDHLKAYEIDCTGEISPSRAPKPLRQP